MTRRGVAVRLLRQGSPRSRFPLTQFRSRWFAQQQVGRDGKPLTESHPCWSCKVPLKSTGWFCGGCHVIQPPEAYVASTSATAGDGGDPSPSSSPVAAVRVPKVDLRGGKQKQPLDYFSVLNVPASFDVDLAKANKTYKSLQKSVHPDHFRDKTEREQGYSETVSSLLSKAISVLRDPLSRARHLLEMNGIFLNEEEKMDDLEFLGEVLEIREQIEDAGSEPDALQRLLDENKSAFDSNVGELSEAFHEGDLPSARTVTKRLIYLSRIRNEIRERMPAS